MKKFIIAIAVALFGAGVTFAQDMASATATYNNGAEALQLGNKTDALAYFQDALNQGLALGDEAADLVANCKKAIPGIFLSLGKEAFNEKNFAEAIAKFEEAVKAGNEYAETEIAAEAANLIPQAKIQSAFEGATAALKAKNYPAAITGYKEVLELDPANKNAALYLGNALGATGDLAGAEEAFAKAVENGADAAVVNGQLSNIFLKKAAALLKGGKYQDAIDHATKANSFGESAQAFLVLGQAASKLNKDTDALAAFEKYLSLAPTAKNANAITFTVGALYQKAGNKAKAIENYKKVLSDPQLGAQAKQLVDSLSK